MMLSMAIILFENLKKYISQVQLYLPHIGSPWDWNVTALEYVYHCQRSKNLKN